LQTGGSTAVAIDTAQIVTLSKSLALLGSTSGSVSIAAPAVAGTTTLTLPATSGTLLQSGTAVTVAQGGTGLTSTPANGALDIGNGTGFTRTTLTAGTNVTITNGAGSISIAASGGGSPGGSPTQVQYNNSGAFGGISGFTSDGTRVTASTTIGVGGATPSTSGAGVTFPATQSASTDANTLDDYEEGTWTPTIIGSSTAGTATYSLQSGSYTRIGNSVNFWLKLQWTGGTGTGVLQVSSLPFTPVVTNLPAMNVIAINISLTAGQTCYGFMTGTVIQLISIPTGGGSDSTVSYDAAGSLYITGTYPTT
jgi:hypothetical protein